MKKKISELKELIRKLLENDFLSDLFVPIHKTGYPFIVIFFIVSLILGTISSLLGWLGIILTIWCIYFFRDPVRYTPSTKNHIISPADGKIISIIDTDLPKEFNEKKKMKKISIFMNVFNVHVNRIPVDGKIKSLNYIPGAFFNASLDKASEKNERMLIKMGFNGKDNLYFTQIAGLIARRIKCDLNIDQSVKAGEKFGIIRFGSRVDLYLPTDYEIEVLKGQTVIGGETKIASTKKLKSPKNI